jgi:diacylglycerol kinase
MRNNSALGQTGRDASNLFGMGQLSTYELIALLTTYTSDTGAHFMNFLAVFSACVVAGYLVASKLDRLTLLMVTMLCVVVEIRTPHTAAERPVPPR